MTTPTIDIEQPTAYRATVEVPVILVEGADPVAVTVVAMPTATPGLVVQPATWDGRFTGAWLLTHQTSGLRFPMSWAGNELDEVVRAAEALGGTGVDWSADKETVVAQIKEHKEAIGEALKAARFPKVEEDGQDTPQDPDKVAPYPRTEAQATADAIARHMTRGLQHRCKETWDLIQRRDDDGKTIYGYHVHAKVAEWALVSVLRDFARVDKDAADAAARKIWDGWEAGDSLHEFTWEWAKEYGLPELPEDEDKPAVADESVQAEVSA